MDLNGDGHTDLISGSWPGEIFLFRGGPDRTFAAPERIRGKDGYYINIGGGIEEQPNGRILVTGHSEEEATDEGRFLKFRGKRVKVAPDVEVWSTGTASAVYAADWDGDADYDLLIGDIGGRVYIVPNEGTRIEPAFGKESGLTCAFIMPVKVQSDAGPVVVDWDEDGDLDLIVGSGDGSVSLFRNVGPKGGFPALALAVQLIPPGEVTYGADAPVEPRRGHRSKVCAADWDGDGRLDLLVGDYATQKPDLPEFTAEEQAEHDRLRKELEVLQRHYSEMFQKLYDESGARDGKERKKLGDDLATVQAKLRQLQAKLPPEYESHGWVWLFLRKPAQG